MNSLFFKEEHKMIQDMVRDFATTKITPVARELDSKEIFPKELVTAMGDLGLMGIMVPEKSSLFDFHVVRACAFH